MYMVSIVSLTLILAFTGLDIISAFTAIVASVNNTGPGLGVVGPSTTYESLEDFQTWVCIFAMLLGRLEIFTLLVVLTPPFGGSDPAPGKADNSAFPIFWRSPT
jgi:trk system potassium uptake protein TrkH